MLTRSRFAVPLDRSDVRSSTTGNLNHADSQLPAIVCRNELGLICCGNPDAKQRPTIISMGSFLIDSALSANEQP